MFKQCSRCNDTKDLNDFHKCKGGLFGKHSICKECRKNYKPNIVYNGYITCNYCQIKKQAKFFYECKKSKNGKQTYCIECQKKKISESKSKLEHFTKIIFNKFTKNNKNILFTHHDVIKKFNDQKGKCAITNLDFEHYVDSKQRIDNVWNISIYVINNENNIDYDNFILITHLSKTMKELYDMENYRIKDIHNDLLK